MNTHSTTSNEGWQDIATAPVPDFDAENWWRDGRPVLVWTGHCCSIAYYSYTRQGKGRWRDFRGIITPTHWMPLPAPPVQP